MAREFEDKVMEAEEEQDKAEKLTKEAESTKIGALEALKQQAEEAKSSEDDEESKPTPKVKTVVISKEVEEREPVESSKREHETKIFTIKTTANREEQVVDFLSANAAKKGFEIYSVIRPHGMRSYIFVEAQSLFEAEQAAYDVPYARGVLKQEIPYAEIEHMVEIVKKEVNIQKGDIAEIISGPFKREKCKISKFDKDKEDVVVELLGSSVPIPITLKMDALKVIRREGEEEEASEE